MECSNPDQYGSPPNVTTHPAPRVFLADGQTQTRSAIVASYCCIDLAEGLEEMAHLIRANANARILN